MVGVVAAVITTGFILILLRRGYLREKFAAFWLLVAGALLIVSIFPAVLVFAADLLGVEVPANLLFMLAAVVLLLVGVQLSYEVGRLDTRTQRLAEEVALLRVDVSRLQKAVDERSERPNGRHGP